MAKVHKRNNTFLE